MRGEGEGQRRAGGGVGGRGQGAGVLAEVRGWVRDGGGRSTALCHFLTTGTEKPVCPSRRPVPFPYHRH